MHCTALFHNPGCPGRLGYIPVPRFPLPQSRVSPFWTPAHLPAFAGDTLYIVFHFPYFPYFPYTAHIPVFRWPDYGLYGQYGHHGLHRQTAFPVFPLFSRPIILDTRHAHFGQPHPEPFSVFSPFTIHHSLFTFFTFWTPCLHSVFVIWESWEVWEYWEPWSAVLPHSGHFGHLSCSLFS